MNKMRQVLPILIKYISSKCLIDCEQSLVFLKNLEGWASVKKRVTSGARVAYFWQTEIKERKKRRYCS